MMNRKPNQRPRPSLDDWNPMSDDYVRGNYNSFLRPTVEAVLDDAAEDETIQENPKGLYVRRVPHDLDKEGLGNLFSSCGTVTSVHLFPPKTPSQLKYGFVNFRTHAEAQAAMMEHHMKPPFNLLVKFARSFKREEHYDYVESERGEEVETNKSPKFKFSHMTITVDRGERKVTVHRGLSDRPEFNTATETNQNYRHRREMQVTETELEMSNAPYMQTSESDYLSTDANHCGLNKHRDGYGTHVQPLGIHRSSNQVHCGSGDFRRDNAHSFRPVEPVENGFRDRRSDDARSVPGEWALRPTHQRTDQKLRRPFERPMSGGHATKQEEWNANANTNTSSMQTGAMPKPRRNSDRDAMVKSPPPSKQGLQHPRLPAKAMLDMLEGKTNDTDDSVHNQDIEEELLATAVLPDGKPVRVIVSHVADKYFWVQLCSEVTKIEALTEKLQKFGKNPQKMINRRVGRFCAARFSKDNTWYRAQISKFDTSQNRVQVYYVDYGNSEETTFDKVMMLPKEFFVLPALAVKCTALATTSGPLRAKVGSIVWLSVVGQDDDRTVIEFRNSPTPQPQIGKKPEATVKPKEETVEYMQTKTVLGELKPDVKMLISVTIPGEKQFWGHMLLPQYKTATVHLFQKMNELHEAKDEENVDCTGVVAAFSETDQSWYRAICMPGVSEGHKVFYVDYGNDEQVKKLKSLPDNIKNCPTLLVCCTIKEHASDESKAELTKHIAVDATLQFASAKKNGSSFEGTLSLVDGGKPVGKAVLQPWHAVVKIPKILTVVHKTAERPRTKKLMKTDLATSAFELTDVQHVILARVVSKDAIYVWLQKSRDDVNKLTDVMNPTGGIVGGSPYEPEIGEIVCACNPDGFWYRAEAMEKTKTTVKVRLVDFGNVEEVSFERVRPFPANERSFPVFALRVGMLDEQAERLDTLRQHEGQDVSVRVENDSTSPWKVKFFDGKTKQPLLDEPEVKKPIPEFSSPKFKPLKSSPCKVALPPNTTVTPSRIYKRDVKETTLPAKTKIKVIVTHTESINIWVVPVETLHELAEVTLMVQEYCTQSTETAYVPGVGEMVCAKFDKDGTWYRAEVKSVDDELVVVSFVDYGNEETVVPANLRKMPKEIADRPVHCTAVQTDASVLPALAQAQEDGSFLETKVVDESVTPAKAVFFIKDGCRIGGSPSTNDVVAESKTVVTEPEAVVAEPKSVVAEIVTATTEPVVGTESAVAPIANGIEKIYWKDIPTEELPLGHVQLAALCIHSPEMVYCTRVSEENIGAMKALHRRINDHCAKAPLANYRPDEEEEVVLAKSAEDNEWYRAVCLDVGSDTCTLLFVDYGNIATTQIAHILPMEKEFAKEKIRTVHCIFNNLCDDSWTVEVCESLKKIVILQYGYDATVIKHNDSKYTIEIPSLIPEFQKLGILKSFSFK